MEIIRKELSTTDLYPANVRYDEATDTVQTLVNGEWVDSPGSDPRTMNLYPPKTGTGAACDSAANIVANLQGLVSGIITAVCGGALAADVGAIIIGWLTVFAGLFGVLLLLAISAGAALLSIGCGDLGTAFTSGTWDTLLCIIRCRMPSTNQLDAQSLDLVKADISSMIGGTAGSVLNTLLDIIGFGGLNAMAATGAETGDCGDCTGCEWCFSFEFQYTQGGWSPAPGLNATGWVAGAGWRGGFIDTGSRSDCYVEINFPDTEITYATITYDKPGGSGPNNVARLRVQSGSTIHYQSSGNPIGSNVGLSATGDHLANKIYVDINSGTTSTTITLKYAEIHGRGVCPFGEPNCE